LLRFNVPYYLVKSFFWYKEKNNKRKSKTKEKQLSNKPRSTCIRKQKQVYTSKWGGQDEKRFIVIIWS
jgi:hypothetical protein